MEDFGTYDSANTLGRIQNMIRNTPADPSMKDVPLSEILSLNGIPHSSHQAVTGGDLPQSTLSQIPSEYLTQYF